MTDKGTKAPLSNLTEERPKRSNTGQSVVERATLRMEDHNLDSGDDRSSKSERQTKKKSSQRTVQFEEGGEGTESEPEQSQNNNQGESGKNSKKKVGKKRRERQFDVSDGEYIEDVEWRHHGDQETGQQDEYLDFNGEDHEEYTSRSQDNKKKERSGGRSREDARHIQDGQWTTDSRSSGSLFKNQIHVAMEDDTMSFRVGGIDSYQTVPSNLSIESEILRTENLERNHQDIPILEELGLARNFQHFTKDLVYLARRITKPYPGLTNNAAYYYLSHDGMSRISRVVHKLQIAFLAIPEWHIKHLFHENMTPSSGRAWGGEVIKQIMLDFYKQHCRVTGGQATRLWNYQRDILNHIHTYKNSLRGMPERERKEEMFRFGDILEEANRRIVVILKEATGIDVHLMETDELGGFAKKNATPGKEQAPSGHTPRSPYRQPQQQQQLQSQQQHQQQGSRGGRGGQGFSRGTYRGRGFPYRNSNGQPLSPSYWDATAKEMKCKGCHVAPTSNDHFSSCNQYKAAFQAGFLLDSPPPN